MAQRLKRLPGIQETQVRYLGREDPQEKEMATHSSALAWRIPWREETGRLQSMGSQRVGHDGATSLHFTSFSIKEKKNQEHFQISGQGCVGVVLPFTEIGKKICAQRAVSRVTNSDMDMLS